MSVTGYRELLLAARITGIGGWRIPLSSMKHAPERETYGETGTSIGGSG